MTATFAELAERDQTVAGLGILLDERQRADWLADHGYTGPVAATYVRYKPGTSMTVGFDTATGPLFGYAVSAEAAPKRDKIIGNAPPGSVRIDDRERRIVLAAPAADRDLPGLGTPPVADAVTLAYKPQRRWVGRTAGQILRCYRPGQLARTRTRWPSLEVPGIRTPAVVDHDRSNGVLRVEALSGTPLHRLAGRQHLITGLYAAGRALALWHRRAPAAPVRADLPDLNAVSAQLATLLPEGRTRISRVAEQLAARAPAAGDQGWCHGDFSADQVLIDDPSTSADPTVALLDWDRSGHGPKAYDLAGADAAGLGPGHELDSREWRALLDGYQELNTLPADLDHFRAVARFARAAEPFRTAQHDWHRRIGANLDRVEELL